MALDFLDYKSTELAKLPKRRTGRHRQLNRPPPTSEQLEEKLRIATNIHVVDDAQPERFGAFLQTMLGELQRCGGKVVLFDAPLNPRLRDSMSWPAYSALYRDYKTAVEREAEKASTSFILINDMVDFKLEDFADFGHLRTEAAIKATSDQLAVGLARIVIAPGKANP
jgi:hypothetical protein